MVIKLGLIVTITLASCIAHKGYSYVRPSKPLFYDRRYIYEDQWSDDNGIPGVAGKDYPLFDRVPRTRFVCQWKYPGYYADPEANCQAYHICQHGGRKDSFLCPNGTLFNQEKLVCTWWYTVDCPRAQSFYSINEAVAKAMEEADRRIGIANEQKLPWGYRRESNRDRYWNENWQSGRRGWNKSVPISHDQDLDFPKQHSYDVPVCPRSSAKSSPHANARHGNLPERNYKSGAEFGKQSISQHRPTFYLPV